MTVISDRRKRRRREGMRGAGQSFEGRMKLKRFVQLTMAAIALYATSGVSAQQVLKVGSTPTGAPFTFLDTKTTTIQGLMVDLITEIGKDAGFSVAVEPMQFSTLVASLT